MNQQLTLHVVDRDFRSRGEMVRGALAAGHAAFGYDDLESLAAQAPHGGIVMLAPALLGCDVQSAIRELDRMGVWLPVIAVIRHPCIEEIVNSMRGGALDVLALPLDGKRFSAVLRSVAMECARYAQTRRKIAEARHRIDGLTPREREVLDRLTEGRSNKDIARAMEISPRTVEVHRAKMMEKLGASHPADAVRLRLELGLPAPDGGTAFSKAAAE